MSDIGRYGPALRTLQQAVAMSEDGCGRSYALSMIGRLHFLRHELDLAAETLDESLDLAGRSGWTAFTPWPESWRAAVDLAQGELQRAEDRLDHAFSLSCQVGDPCWEGISSRGLGLLQSARGDVDGAVTTLRDARVRCTRLPTRTCGSTRTRSTPCVAWPSSTSLPKPQGGSRNWATSPRVAECGSWSYVA